MKKRKLTTRVIISMLVLSLILPIFTVSAAPDISEKGELRGVWVATVLNIDYPSKPTTNPEALKSEAIKILDNAQSTGLNAVFLQVRPASDALYKSRYYPWSKYLTGRQGQAPEGDFDPLEFWVTEAHKRGIELHAWINPYRVTKKTAKDPAHDYASLDASNPAILNPSWIVQYGDGNLYYNPGIPEVRKQVIDGVMEMVENYDIDGIHFDDYFYPGKDFNDKAAFEQYGAGFANIHDWRRENVNMLISDLSRAIKASSRKVSFGISPFGIWANSNSNKLGSDTRGLQSYYDQYADTRKWVQEGWLDYIAPQLYWNIGFAVADYSKLLSWWQNVVQGTGVQLYIGQAAYRSGNADPASAWYGVAEMEKQLKLNASVPEVKGSIFFSYKSLENNPALNAVIKGIYQQKDGIAAGMPVSISRPSADIKTNYTQYYINGSSDPTKPLYINGRLVENRSSQGYFGVLVPLSKGANVFTLSQDGTYTTRIIFRNTAAAAAPVQLSKAEIPAASAFPQAQEYRSPGEKITLSCQAPIGSKVTVKIGGKSYEMKPAAAASSASGLAATTYSYVYTIPAYTGTPRTIDLGAPVYTLNYKGASATRKAAAKIGVVMKNAPFYAKVEKAVAYTYNTTSTANGAAYELYNGMIDFVTGMTGSYVRLGSGQWVSKNDVKVYTDKAQKLPDIKTAAYKAGESWDAVELNMPIAAAALASFDGKTIKLNMPAGPTAAAPQLPVNALFASITAAKADNRTVYTMTLKDNQVIEGYYVEKTASGIALKVKRPVKAKEGDQPLAGITIMVDPGHGGNENGTWGPLGLSYAEKRINLETALKLQAELEALGAAVLMTRTTDKAVSLDERLTASRNAKPDMFISVHANSMEDNVDINKVEGFSMFYDERHSKPLADKIFNDVLLNLNRNSKGIHSKNFYVIRGSWTPSVLIESGFVPNPREFEWLIDENEQARLAKTVAEAIAAYFKR